jgi:hypothetical protein
MAICLRSGIARDCSADRNGDTVIGGGANGARTVAGKALAGVA